MLRFLFGLVLAGVLCGGPLGCQSARSWSRCPGIYSGVRYYADQLPELPADGKIFFTADLPFSALVDTLALPATAFVDRETPRGGYPIGCRWASPRPGR